MIRVDCLSDTHRFHTNGIHDGESCRAALAFDPYTVFSNEAIRVLSTTDSEALAGPIPNERSSSSLGRPIDLTAVGLPIRIVPRLDRERTRL